MKKGSRERQPDSVTWGTLITYYERKGDLDKMKGIFEVLLKDKEKLIAHPFSHMIRGCILTEKERRRESEEYIDDFL
jgi:pentatricopeptide repeat protein